MRRGLLQDLANTACQMLVGWRLSEDIDWLLQQRRGDLAFDLLTGATMSDGAAVEALHVGEEVRLWFMERLEDEAVPPGTVQSAVLTCQVTAEAHDHKRRPSVRHIELAMRCRCEIAAGDRVLVGELTSG
jgi:hypothetical protein